MKYFLLVFDRRAGTIVSQETYDEDRRREALDARFDREAKERGNPDREVVLLGAESLEDVMRTHSRYFPERLRERAS